MSGTSLAGLAMRHQVKANQLRRWVTVSQRIGAAPAAPLLPVMVAVPPAPSTAPIVNAIEGDLAGAVVKVARGADSAALRTVIAVLRSLPT